MSSLLRFYKKKRVSPRCIQLSLLHDKELAMLTRGVVIPDGGVKPYIHPVLMKKGSVEEQQKVDIADPKAITIQ